MTAVRLVQRTTNCGLSGSWSSEHSSESSGRIVHQRHSAVPDAALRSEHRHQQAVQKSGCDIEKRKMAKRQNSDEVRETCAIGSRVSVVQRHADRAFREVRRSARGGDSWARRARR